MRHQLVLPAAQALSGKCAVLVGRCANDFLRTVLNRNSSIRLGNALPVDNLTDKHPARPQRHVHRAGHWLARDG
jgi:hypothetical protein